MKIGEVLEGWRLYSGLTVAAAAEEIGIPADTYRRLELGASPQMTTFWAILVWLVKV